MGYAMLLVVALAALMLLLLCVPGVREVATAPNTVPGRLRALGLSGQSVVLLALYALVQTALSEEILFRGFLAKRLITRLGFHRGNLVQSVLFGAMHLLLFAGPTGQPLSLPRAMAVVAFTSLIGWGLGYLNERAGNGSIVPSWWTHGLTNIVAYSTLAFGGR
jgi:membrane protease YdiL (CAAX protease family)